MISLNRLRRTALVGALAVGLAAVNSPASAQRPDSIPIGLRLRVWRSTAPGRVTGVLDGADSASLVLSSRWRPPTRYRYADITAVAIGHREKRPGGAGRGAKRGLLFGAGVGLLATGAAAVYEMNSTEDALVSVTMIMGLYSVAFMGVSAGVGAIVGSTDRVRWERVWTR